MATLKAMSTASTTGASPSAGFRRTPSGWHLAWIVIVILGVLAWVLPTIVYLLILENGCVLRWVSL